MDRVYVILNIKNGKRGEAVQTLQATPGVRWIDALEGQWDIITTMEASDRTRLAEYLVRALAVLENITEDLQVLPTRDGSSGKFKFKSRGEVKTCLTESA